ncbi:hypothetical protein C4E04_12175 [Microvirga sp. 17 mud 1-3]|nr:hypothetical protein C4E04_12175 [Microvirga sp. 17 mud 1-3]
MISTAQMKRCLRPNFIKSAALLLGACLLATPVGASSDDAWQAMRDKLRQGCLAQAKIMGLGQVEVAIDPFGSESYALAILTRRTSGKDKKPPVASVCLMDKASGRVEIGGEIPLK